MTDIRKLLTLMENASQSVLMELNDKPLKYDFTFVTYDGFEASFEIGNLKYTVYGNKNDFYFHSSMTSNEDNRKYNGIEELEITFECETLDSMELTGTGNQFLIFSTVFKIVNDYITHHDPDIGILSFSAEEPSRRRLYAKAAKSIGRFVPGFSLLEMGDYRDSAHYYCIRDDCKR